MNNILGLVDIVESTHRTVSLIKDAGDYVQRDLYPNFQKPGFAVLNQIKYNSIE